MTPAIEVYRAAGVRLLDTSTVVEQRARLVLRRRADSRAALGARHAVDAPARRLLRRVRVRHDADPRRQASTQRRPRLRALRPRRLAGSAPDDRRGRRASRADDARHPEPLARYLRAQGIDSGVIRTAWERRPARRPSRSDPCVSSPSLFARARSDDVDQREGGRDGALLRPRACGGRRVGDVLSDRPASEAPAAVGGDRRVDAGRHRSGVLDARGVLGRRRRRRGRPRRSSSISFRPRRQRR